ncbi:DUF1294 domain-containing protein [Massilia sp. PWRC2]|uniref:DUF1294 domain-containing protein n=1 Tax=Massilia sp. PWRC2 TaxID=2804626 RepID=UPI003CF7B493
MQGRKPVRYQGTISSWKDEQGYGFIAPNGGGPPVFVHIHSFKSGLPRPYCTAIVTYVLGNKPQGRPCAADVAYAVIGGNHKVPRQTGALPIMMALIFMVVLAALVLLQQLAAVVLGTYLAMSLLTFIVYGRDKAAAGAQRRRTSEKKLLMLGTAGGWPGALLAQHLLRHKSKKTSFQTAFRISVVINCAALGALVLCSGNALLGTLFL